MNSFLLKIRHAGIRSSCELFINLSLPVFKKLQLEWYAGTVRLGFVLPPPFLCLILVAFSLISQPLDIYSAPLMCDNALGGENLPDRLSMEFDYWNSNYLIHSLSLRPVNVPYHYLLHSQCYHKRYEHLGLQIKFCRMGNIKIAWTLHK